VAVIEGCPVDPPEEKGCVFLTVWLSAIFATDLLALLSGRIGA
jgi:hypothetical protein